MSSLNYPEQGEPLFPWLRRLFAFVKSLELKGDGVTCRVDRTEGGSTLHILRNGGTAGGITPVYLGPFRISFSDDGQVRIDHGGNPLSSFAGLANVNGDTVQVTPGTVAAATGFVILRATITSGTVSFSFEISGTLPTAVNGSGTGAAVLGEIIADGSGRRIVQYYHGIPVILIGGECSNAQTS